MLQTCAELWLPLVAFLLHFALVLVNVAALHHHFSFCGNVILLWYHVHKRWLGRLLWSPASKIHVELSIVYCMKDLVMEVLHGFSLV